MRACCALELKRTGMVLLRGSEAREPFQHANHVLLVTKVSGGIETLDVAPVRRLEVSSLLCHSTEVHQRKHDTPLVSEFAKTVQRMGETEPFEEWIKREEFRDVQIKHIAGNADLDAAIRVLDEDCIFVGLIDRFDESLVIIKKKLGDPRFDIRYTRENVARDTTIKKRLIDDPSTNALLKDANKIDNELYNYVVGELYEKQKVQFGETLASEVQTFQAGNTLPQVNLNATLSLIKRNLVYKPVLRYAQRSRT